MNEKKERMDSQIEFHAW